MMMTLTTSLLLAALCADPPPADVPPAEIERLAAAVDRILSVERRFEALLRQRNWMQKPGEPPPRSDRDPPFREERALLRIFGRNHAALSPAPANNVKVFFDEYVYSFLPFERFGTVHLHRGGEEWRLLVQTPPFDPFRETGSLGEALRESLPMSLIIDGDIATYRFRFASEQRLMDEYAESTGGARHTAWAREIVIDLSEPPRLLGWTTDVPRLGPDHPGQPDRWSVEAWQEFEGLPFPKRVRRETQVPGEGGTLMAYIQIEEVEALTPIEPDALPTRPLPEGMPFDGEGVLFIVGSAEVVHRGQALRLSEPLWTLPSRERLAELLSEARPR